MARDGSGNYNLPAGNPVSANTIVSSTWANSTLSDIGAALTQSLSKDGQTVPTANLSMGNNRLTNLANGSLATDAVNLGQLQATAGQAGGVGDRSLLVNGNGAINQRVYVSGTATTAANQATLDRWRVVVSGQSLTFTTPAPDSVMTAPAGGVDQIIEAGWIEGGVYTLSWTGTATATVNGSAITNGGQTASLPANTAVTVRLIGGTFTKVQFERGTVATSYQRRPPGVELQLCQRDYAKSYAIATVPGTATAAGAVSMSSAVGGSIVGNFRFPVPMRTTPTGLNVWTTGGGPNQWAAYTSGGVVTAYAASLAATDTSLRVTVSIGAGEIWAEGHWIAATGF